MSQIPPEKQAQINSLRQILGAGEDQSKWSEAWSQKLTPWDSGGNVQPSLIGFMTKTDIGLKLCEDAGQKSVLIPGCGSGYDARFFAEQCGFKTVVGIDIASEAVRIAQSLLPQDLKEQRVMFETCNYLNKSPSHTPFHLVYDYTFFCALPPSLREKWAEAHVKNIKANGHLLCLVYPIHGDRQGGPPYSVSPELYSSVLSPYFSLEYQGIPPEQPESRKGVEMIMLWKRNV
ncbi:unnamed protein product [Sympodiomycopsis kandeliae]